MLSLARTAARTAALARRNPPSQLQSVRNGGGGHGPRGQEPSGYFLGRPGGQKHTWYWWEPMWYFGYYGAFATFFVFQIYSPKVSVTDAAKLEAHRRMAARGETFGWPFPADYSLVKNDK
ncbi:uncharacterized protein EV422DRAFT_570734 [Fimicolochytrium jonesii]|uniref:uncharacterized protein n=1 Tax=Fimicolochytrium jonesii TaxID=1396493 RepID=UPI0022FE56E7|nr:uncharacterized protein EV422DRAFT_570734 [Fimicolochytrium jonesii]KAI8817393.1 hypothetical protein EV422DRAFT_570734 [Fimicolochytrium jonesii]